VIVGSTSLALQGIPIRPKDIDILTTKGGAYAINAQLREYESRPVRLWKSRLFQSHLGDFKVRGVKVQVMGDLEVRIGNRWVNRTSRLRNPQTIRLGGHLLPVTPLRKQLESYKLLARRKSKAKVRKVERFLMASNKVRTG
jgi:hypothetical protein